MEISKLPEISFIDKAKHLTFKIYKSPNKVVSEGLGRLAASILLSPAAALDIAFHGLLLFPTLLYAIGNSIYQQHSDFTLPWQHLQRIQNAVSPLLFGSIASLLHPLAGIAMSEATDKHIVVGILASNVEPDLETPCSPIHSLSLIKNIVQHHRYAEVEGERQEIFPVEYVEMLEGAKSLEESLESLQAQEFVHRMMSLTLFFMTKINMLIENSSLNDLNKATLVRISGFLIPVLSAVDATIALLAQAFLLTTGVVRLISGRGAPYTEFSTHPLMHASFLIQNVLKTVGNVIGTFVWFASPTIGFKASLIPANVFFKLQMHILLWKIERKMLSAEDGTRFIVPIVYGRGERSLLSIPSDSMHQTYLVVEKEKETFNLYWVNRPKIKQIQGLEADKALMQIRSMLEERFPFMDAENITNYLANGKIKGRKPEFKNSTEFKKIKKQGCEANCVVSNLFGTLLAIDKIKSVDNKVMSLRYRVVRESLMKDYSFYRGSFFPFAKESEGYSLERIWTNIEKHPNAAI